MTRSAPQRETMVEAGLNLIGQALSIYDQNLCLAACNRRFQEMFDLPEALVSPGAGFADTIRLIATRGDYGPLPDIEAFVAQRVAQAQDFRPHYLERTRPNGQVISIEGAPLPQGGWVAVYTDITPTKRVESLLRAHSEELSDQLLSHAEELSGTNRKLAASIKALEEAKRQLTETEARTRLTTEMMPAHIAHVDSTGCYTFTNGRLADVFPKRPAKIIGRPMGEVLGDHAFARIKPHLEAAYGGQNPVFEFTEDQNRRRLRVAFTPDGQGGVYVLSMDVTEETQARVALQQNRRRAMAAQMTSGLAHDFSNLLTVIIGMQGKLARMDLPPEAQELIDSTLKAAGRGGRLLDRLSAMTSQRGLRPQACDLHGLLNELKILATPALPRGVGLSVLDNTPDHPLLLDPGRLQDALLNLVLNARDACGSAGQITLAAHLVGQTWLEISVGDTGPGFSSEALEQALNPFFTTKGQEGSGLGLAMVYDMVKSAGGDIRVGNTVSGAQVTLRLPYRRAPQVAGGIVLLVEDNDDLRAQLRDMLLSLCLPVIEATSVDEASALLADVPEISLVLSDIRLKGAATGVDLAQRLQQTAQTTQTTQTKQQTTQQKGPHPIPVVLMTSLPPEDALHQRARDLAPVLQKPFDMQQLADLIQKRPPHEPL